MEGVCPCFLCRWSLPIRPYRVCVDDVLFVAHSLSLKVLASIKLLHQSETLYLESHIDERVDLNDPEIDEAVKLIISFKDDSFEMIYETEFDWNNVGHLCSE